MEKTVDTTPPRAVSAPHFRLLVMGNSLALAQLIQPYSGTPEWSVEFAEDGFDAVTKAEQERPDVIVVEYQGSASEASELIRQVRLVQPSSKVILLVERATADGVVAAIREHAFSVFSHPYAAGDVRDMIEAAARLPNWSDGIEVLSADPTFVTLRLRCSLQTADRLLQFMREIPIALPPAEQEEVAQAFRELLLNAIEHGAGFNPDQSVQVSRVRTKRTLVYHIVDPGGGFSRAELYHAAIAHPDDVTAHVEFRQAQGLRAGGFGMLLASSLVDEVIYNEQGNQVIMIKHLE